MAALRELCATAGLGEVRTYLQTGNLLFESDMAAEEVAGTIEAALTAHGLRNAPAVVRSLPELQAIVGDDPFRKFPAETHTRFVTLFRNSLPGGLEDAADNLIHIVAVRAREVLAVLPLERPQGLDVNGWLTKQTRLEGTTRYFHVVEEVTRLLAV